MDSLKRSIAEGADIAATHELFSRADNELMELLEWNNYTLILDEVMEVISLVQGMKKDDFKVLMDSNLIEITPYNKVIWKADPKLDTQYNKIRDYALELFFKIRAGYKVGLEGVISTTVVFCRFKTGEKYSFEGEYTTNQVRLYIQAVDMLAGDYDVKVFVYNAAGDRVSTMPVM